MRLLPYARLARRIALGAIALASGAAPALAQSVDCGRLQQQIAQMDGAGGNRYAQAARRQQAELARTQAYSHQLGCDSFTSFFGANPQCGGLQQRIQQMQANLGQLQASGNAGPRGELVQRFNAYCRGAQPPRQRGFFESLFGGGDEPRQQVVPDGPPIDAPNPDGETQTAHGGAQAVCVRTCDGGFFPLGISSHHSGEDLTQMCQALCPGAEVAVFTRNPDADIKTAAGLDGKPYVDLPNALKFQKTFVADCSCRPKGKSWAEALSNAEEVLGNTRKGDILVTPEKSDELSRPKMDPKQKASLLRSPATAMSGPAAASQAAAVAAQNDTPDPNARIIRHVGPQP